MKKILSGVNIINRNAKKTLAVLIMLIFCTVQTSWAGEAIIIGSDGQARYENDIMQNQTRTNNMNSINNKEGQIKMEKTNINIEYIDWQNPELAKYQQKLFGYTKGYKTMGMDIHRLETYIKQDGYKNDELILKAPLKDGDYALLYKTIDGIFYAMEYHNDGSIMGFVLCIDAKKTDSEYIGIFYEQRYETNTYKKSWGRTESYESLVQKHVMIVDIQKENNTYKVAQFVYSEDLGNNHPHGLLCYSINNKVYIANDDSNLLVDLTYDIDLQKNQMKNYQKDTSKETKTISPPISAKTVEVQENKTENMTTQTADVVFDKIDKGVKTTATVVGVGLMGVAGLGGLAVAAVGLPIILPAALYSYFKDK